MNIENFIENKNKKLVSGYSETKFVQCYIFSPKNIDECIEIIELCKAKGLKICSRGSGLSYGDIITNEDNVIVDFTLMNKVLSWNIQTGLIIVQPGTTFAQIYSLSLIDHWTLSSCPGSSDITIGGAVSNNIHGKDSFKNGNFGNQVLEIKLLLASGKIITINRSNNYEYFKAIVGGMGLLGIIVEITLQLKKIPSPFVTVRNKISKNIFETIEHIEEAKKNFDFSIAWIDSFSKNNSIGRGFVTSAKWEESNLKLNLLQLKKSLEKSKKIFGILPARPTWYLARPFFKPNTVKKLNFLNFQIHKLKNSFYNKDHHGLLFTKYNFMHNKIPDLKHVFRPEGFLELQLILPKKNISFNLKKIIVLCQKLNIPSLLNATKLHSSDDYFLSFEGDGYSFAITLQLKGRKEENIKSNFKEIFAFIADCKGKVYLAKDEYLDKHYFRKMYPRYIEFVKIKNILDPNFLFTSDLYKRLF